MSENKGTKFPKTWGLRTPAFFARCEGVKIDVQLVNGEHVAGELLGVDTYDIFLQALGGATVMVPKHAVLLILLDEGAS